LFPFLDERRDQVVVAMPVLATGSQGWPADVMLPHWLARGLAISELKIVERVPERAAELAATMADFKAKTALSALKPSQPTAFDVFLSFSSVDAEAADCARVALQKRGDTKRGFDFRIDIDKGKSWQEELDRAISSCTARSLPF
jgi:hypothetical protein